MIIHSLNSDLACQSRITIPAVNIYEVLTPQVRDRWSGVSFSNQWWVNNGVIQVTLDNRAGGHFGKRDGAGRRQLSILKLRDFIDGINIFAMPFVDADKIVCEAIWWYDDSSLCYRRQRLL